MHRICSIVSLSTIVSVVCTRLAKPSDPWCTITRNVMAFVARMLLASGIEAVNRVPDTADSNLWYTGEVDRRGPYMGG